MGRPRQLTDSDQDATVRICLQGVGYRAQSVVSSVASLKFHHPLSNLLLEVVAGKNRVGFVHLRLLKQLAGI